MAISTRADGKGTEMSRLIDADRTIQHLTYVCGNGNDGMWGTAQLAYIECFKKFIQHEDSIELDDILPITCAMLKAAILDYLKANEFGSGYIEDIVDIIDEYLSGTDKE